MALIVGNLLTDPAAQSFISLADADDYIGVEQNDTWNLARSDEQEAALVRASRWLAGAYRFAPLDAAGLAQVGRVVARLAAETVGKPLFAGTDTGAVVASERVGPVAVTYATGLKADAAGIAWPWLKPMLSGLIQSGATSFLVRA